VQHCGLRLAYRPCHRFLHSPAPTPGAGSSSGWVLAAAGGLGWWRGGGGGGQGAWWWWMKMMRQTLPQCWRVIPLPLHRGTGKREAGGWEARDGGQM
jgi:hypothetical protein